MGEEAAHLIWGHSGYQEYSTSRLEELTREANKVSLKLVEAQNQYFAFYLLHVNSNDQELAVVHLGRFAKRTTAEECTLPEMAEAIHMRARLARTLGVEKYTPAEEVIALSFMGKKSDTKQHLSPADEGKLVRYTIECAEAIGLAKIQNIGDLKPSADKLLEAKTYLSSNPVLHEQHL